MDLSLDAAWRMLVSDKAWQLGLPRMKMIHRGLDEPAAGRGEAGAIGLMA